MLQHEDGAEQNQDEEKEILCSCAALLSFITDQSELDPETEKLDPDLVARRTFDLFVEKPTEQTALNLTTQVYSYLRTRLGALEELARNIGSIFEKELKIEGAYLSGKIGEEEYRTLVGNTDQILMSSLPGVSPEESRTVLRRVAPLVSELNSSFATPKVLAGEDDSPRYTVQIPTVSFFCISEGIGLLSNLADPFNEAQPQNGFVALNTRYFLESLKVAQKIAENPSLYDDLKGYVSPEIDYTPSNDPEIDLRQLFSLWQEEPRGQDLDLRFTGERELELRDRLLEQSKKGLFSINSLYFILPREDLALSFSISPQPNGTLTIAVRPCAEFREHPNISEAIQNLTADLYRYLNSLGVVDDQEEPQNSTLGLEFNVSTEMSALEIFNEVKGIIGDINDFAFRVRGAGSDIVRSWSLQAEEIEQAHTVTKCTDFKGDKLWTEITDAEKRLLAKLNIDKYDPKFKEQLGTLYHKALLEP